jgi:K(+)-stimulated pyrophosphate-energized sodium pump
VSHHAFLLFLSTLPTYLPIRPFQLKKSSRGTDVMTRISDRIQSGARIFLYTQYRYVSGIMLLVTVLLTTIYSINPPSGDSPWDGLRYGVAFAGGVVVAACAGWDAMVLATDANSRTAQAADEQYSGGGGGLGHALGVAYTAGTAIGLTIVSLGLLGVSLFFYIMTLGWDEDRLQGGSTEVYILAVDALTAFGFGASAVALFARLCGGIYTTGADVGADLSVTKLDPALNIVEDDVRNPAVIADFVGDNVGDIAGMGGDLLESYIGSLIAALSLANGDVVLIMVPLWLTGAGILASIMGYCFVNPEHVFGYANDAQRDLLWNLRRGTLVAAVMCLMLCLGLVPVLFRDNLQFGFCIFGCVAIGLVEGLVIEAVTEYFTSYSYTPTRSIAKAGLTGPATVVIQGLGMGMLSCSVVALSLAVTILSTNALAGGPYGVAMASVGMLSTLGLGLASSAFGPIVDNAGGIARMADLGESVIDTTDRLDAMGNTTAATGKGFAIGSAVLTSLSLLSAFKTKAQIDTVPLSDPLVLSGVLFGAMMPFLFASMTILSVQTTANAVIQEVHRQFHEIVGLKEGAPNTYADSDTCIAIITKFSLQEMILPGLYALLCPLVVGFLVGPKTLSGMLGGAITSGAMLAIMMANSGGAWDNAKKYVEIERPYHEHDDNGGGAETEASRRVQEATAVGDNVGDPCKDTAGPSLNILIKLMSMCSLVIAPLLQGVESWELWYFGLVPLAIGVLATLCVSIRKKQRLANHHAFQVDPGELSLSASESSSIVRRTEMTRLSTNPIV